MKHYSYRLRTTTANRIRCRAAITIAIALLTFSSVLQANENESDLFNRSARVTQFAAIDNAMGWTPPHPTPASVRHTGSRWLENYQLESQEKPI